MGIALIIISGWRIFLGLIYQDMFKYEAVMCIFGLIFGVVFCFAGWKGLAKLGQLANDVTERTIRENFDIDSGGSGDAGLYFNEETGRWEMGSPDTDGIQDAGDAAGMQDESIRADGVPVWAE